MDRSARFWDWIAPRYARQPVADQAAYQKKLEITRRYLGPDVGVVELGCGTGSTAIAHAPHAGRIRAFDVSSAMIGIARGKAEAAGVSNVVFEQRALDAVDLPAGSVDVVLALSLLHLLDDRDAAIARAQAMLKPGGVFVTSTACLADSHNWLRFVAPLGSTLGLLPRVRFFTREDLLRSLERAGFEIEHDWLPGKGKAVFLVARKPEPGAAS